MDRLLTVTAKINRAEEHIESLKTELWSFRERGPYTAVGYDEVETGDRVVRFRISEAIPIKIALIFGDAIHNLRASLDHVAWQLSLACGGTPNDSTGFPIFYKALADVDAEIARKIPGANLDIIRLVKTHEPYKGGRGDILWRLHRLDIIDKHRLLVTVGTSNLSIHIRGETPIQALYPNVSRPMRGIPPVGLALEDGAELVRVKRADRTTNYADPQFLFQVALGEVFEGKPIVPALEKLRDSVRGAVDALSPFLTT